MITRYFASHSGHALSSFYFPVLRLGLIMGKRKDLSKEDIASIINLYKVKTLTKDIAKIVGVSERTVQAWTKRFRDAGQLVTPHHKGRPGKARKTSHRSLAILKREVITNPCVCTHVKGTKPSSVEQCVS